MAEIKIKNLCFSYASAPERKILEDVSLNIRQGEYVLLCGRSGSGKTTLLRHLKSVMTPAGERSGEVLFDGKPLGDMDAGMQASRVGFVMQSPDDQIVTDKVWHELAFGLESIGEDPLAIRARVAEMASYFGIQNWFERDVCELSGGQKQLLNLAAIMTMQPDVLILDEPTSQLDPIAATDFLNTISKINTELGTTVIITEHRLEDIYHAVSRAVVMENGRIIADDDPARVAHLIRNNAMFAAMPAPVRIYYGAGAECNEKCPLTVKEGREWLEKITGSRFLAAEEKCADNGMKNEDRSAKIQIKDLWFRYSKKSADILKGVDLEVKSGELFAIVGGNGTGKSTLLKNITGVLRPYSGSIVIGGKKFEKYKNGELFRNNLSMLPQDPKSIFLRQTVREDLEEMLGHEHYSKIERKIEKDGYDAVPVDERIAEIAKVCDISHILKSHPYDISQGELQRAALAKILLTEPKIILMDEPTKGMDCFFKNKLAELFAKLKENGVTILMVSHDIEFCASHADRVGMFFNGNIVTVGSPKEFFGGNSFYTTAASRMSRHVFKNAVTAEMVVEMIRQIEN